MKLKNLFAIIEHLWPFLHVINLISRARLRNDILRAFTTRAAVVCSKMSLWGENRARYQLMHFIFVLTFFH